MRKIAKAFLGLLLACCLTGPANATLIDFTSEDWQGVVNHSSFTKNVDGIEVTLSTNRDTLTWNEEHGDINLDAYGLQGLGDGIGIRDDEIAANEILTISFKPDVVVETIYLLDLFGDEVNDDITGELAQFNFDGDAWIETDSGIGTYGFFEIQTGNTETHSYIQFSSQNSDWDFSVAGLEVSAAPVPEPTTALLFGIGLVGLAGVSRRKK